MKLGLRLGLIYLVMAILLLSGAHVVVQSREQIENEVRNLQEDDSEMLRLLWDLSLAFEHAWKNARLAATATQVEEARSVRDDIETLLVNIHRLQDPEEEDEAAELQQAWNQVSGSLSEMESHRRRAAAIFEARVYPSLGRFSTALRALESQRRKISADRFDRIRALVTTARKVFWIYISVLVAAGIFMALYLRFRVVEPIYRLGRATEIIASGDLEHRVDDTAGDEVGDLAKRFNAMSSRLAQAKKMKMEFLSMVSHEMRTPLTAIGGYAGLVLSGRRGAISGQQAEALKIIADESQRLNLLVEDLLDAARAEAGAFRIEPAPTDLAAALAATIAPLERQAEARKIKLTSDFSALAPCLADGPRLGQALRNLVGNALKFTPEEGRVEARGFVRGEPGGERDIIIAVSDTGAGIPAETIPHLFERFYQVAGAPGGAVRGAGVGLGLAIVNEIAMAHGGRVEVESVLDKGTSFRIVIPYRPLAG